MTLGLCAKLFMSNTFMQIIISFIISQNVRFGFFWQNLTSELLCELSQARPFRWKRGTYRI